MTAEEFVLWAGRQERGRYELIDGLVVQMNAERSVHERIKLNIAIALRNALRRSGLKGETYGDGMAVLVTEHLVHEPDSLVRLGAPLHDDATIVTDPVIVVEVLSPSTGPVDTSTKLANYFTLPSVENYLVVNTTARSVQHYYRGSDGRPTMRVVTEGVLDCTPPGLQVGVEEFFAD
jgi:Uma2 family endonuclease